MTGHKALSAGGRPLSAQIAASLPELVSHIVSSLLTEVPLYARLPAEELHGEVVSIIEHNVRIFADLLAEQRLAKQSELDRQRQSARRRAEEGVPLDAVLEAYLLGTSVLWQDITCHATADDFADIQTGQRLLLGYLRQLTAAVSAEYMDARQSLLNAEHDARCFTRPSASGPEPFRSKRSWKRSVAATPTARTRRPCGTPRSRPRWRRPRPRIGCAPAPITPSISDKSP